MALRIQIVLITCMILAIVYIVEKIRKKQLDFRYGIGWLIVIVCIMILSVWPVLLDKIAKIVGIASPMNMLFFFGFCFSVIIIFSLSMTISQLNDKVKKLSQEIAILRKDIYDSYNKCIDKKEV